MDRSMNNSTCTDKSVIGGGTHRDCTIDILKGIGIILVVLGHANFPFRDWVYLFHMSLFFITSGLLWKDKNVKDIHAVKRYVVSKVKTLYVPFVTANIVFVLLHNACCKIGIYTDNVDFLNIAGPGNILVNAMTLKETIIAILKSFMFSGSEQLLGAMWFLRILFIVAVLHAILFFITSRYNSRVAKIIDTTVFLSFCLVSTAVSYCGMILPLGLTPLFASFIVYEVGIVIKRVDYIALIKKYRTLTLIVSFVVLMIGGQFCTIEVSAGKIENALSFLILSLAGWTLIYGISNLLINNKVGCLIRYIGHKSIWILLFHFCGFKIVTWIYIIQMNDNRLLLAEFPILYNSGWLWIIYSFVGICFPLILERLFDVLKKHLHHLIGRVL